LLLQVFRVVASILKLANLIFIPTTNMDGTEGCTVGNEYGE
jgi:myosin-1